MLFSQKKGGYFSKRVSTCDEVSYGGARIQMLQHIIYKVFLLMCTTCSQWKLHQTMVIEKTSFVVTYDLLKSIKL